MNNTWIRTTLGSLLNILDARTTVSIYGRKDDIDDLIYNQYLVYEIFYTEMFEKLQNCTVIGISTTISITNITIMV